MRQRILNIRTSCRVLALGIAVCAGGCYGTPRTSVPDAGGGFGGIGGTGGSRGGSDAGDAISDANPTDCKSVCPGPSSGPATGDGACVSGECRISCNATYPVLCAVPGACVDLTSDDKNCGSCGHDCLGGTCAGGQCQPVLIAQYFGHPQSIYIGAQAVYVTNDLGYVGRANKDGSDLKPLAMPGFAASAFYGTFVAEDGESVFLSRYGGGLGFQLSHCQTSGCDATATAIGGQYSQYFAVDQADHKIVWVGVFPFTTPERIHRRNGVAEANVPGGSLADLGSSGSRLVYSQAWNLLCRRKCHQPDTSRGWLHRKRHRRNPPLTILGVNSTSLFLYDGNAIASVPSRVATASARRLSSQSHW